MVSLIRPSVGRITNPFGARNPPSSPLPFHRGTDFGHGNGTAAELRVVAPMSGYISQRIASGAGTYGKHFYLTQGNATVILAHLADFIVGSGQVVAGQHIGTMGSTGTTAVHLHEELLINNVRVDPMLYTASGSTAGGGGVPIEVEPVEVDMFLIAHTDGTAAGLHVLTPVDLFQLTDPNDIAQFQAMGLPVIRVTGPAGLDPFKRLTETARGRIADVVASRPLKAAVDLTGIPTALENGQAARDAIVKA